LTPPATSARIDSNVRIIPNQSCAFIVGLLYHHLRGVLKKEILSTLEYSKNIIISPDVDGLMSATLLSRNLGHRVVGTYDKSILCLAEGINPAECLFVDCDMNTSEFASIGNHMRLMEDNICIESFNPNVHFATKKYNEKFPYATCYLIAFAIEAQTTTLDKQRMAYADSTYKNAVDYAENMRNWSTRMDDENVRYVLSDKVDVSEVAKEYEDKQGLVSRRLGLEKYLVEMNTALKKHSAWNFAFSGKLTTIKKYKTGLVDKNTAIRYNKDIISYAEIYGGEYIVTYKDLEEV
jgi:hypothetical protein